MIAQIAALVLIAVLISGTASAHCPFCTAGVGAAAAGAAYLGVAKPVLGLFVGALGVSMGFWAEKKISKEYVPLQKWVVIAGSFILTVIPVLPIIGSQEAIYMGLMGSYGSMLNTTYSYDASLVTSILGGLVVVVAPHLSRKITELRGKHIDYQGIIVNLVSLLLLGVLVQVI